MPILPLYLTYTLVGIVDLLGTVTLLPAALALAGIFVGCIGMTYVGALRQAPWQAPLANVMDPSAQQMITFLRANTTASDLIVFSKPRSIALFTNRRTASLGPEESAEDSANFLQRAVATLLVQTAWTPSSWNRFIASHHESLSEVFRDQDFQVFRIRFEEGLPKSRAAELKAGAAPG